MDEEQAINPLKKFFHFWAWIATREDLPDSKTSPALVGQATTFRKLFLSRDALPSAPDATTPSSPSLFYELFLSRDKLPGIETLTDAPSRDNRPSLLSYICSREKLPSLTPNSPRE